MKKIFLVMAMVILIPIHALCEMPVFTSTAVTSTSDNVLTLANATTGMVWTSETTKTVIADLGRRLVRVMIVDPETNVSLTDCVLYSEPEKLTDMTNQELFYAIQNFQDIVNVYNKKRVKMLDKEASKKYGRDIYLEPVKIRNLKMVVITVASF